MFAKIAAFELRYQFRNPVFWVVAILFFLLTFGAVTAENITIGSGGNVNVNAPSAIMQISQILTLFFMFVTTAFVANVIVRDDESGFGPMVRATQVRKFDYLFGRFVGAFLIAAIAFIAVPLAIFIGSLMPWVDPETVGINRLSYYLFSYFILALPGIFLTSSVFFAIATATRSMIYTYVAVVAFLVLYLSFLTIIGNTPEWQDMAAIFEPFGLGAIAVVTEYWTVTERNSMLPALEGALLYNRLIALGISLLALAFAYRSFSFVERGISKRKMKKQQKQAAKLAKVPPQIVQELPAYDIKGAAWARFWAQMRLEMRMVVRSPAFFVLMLIGLFNASAGLLNTNEIYGTPAIPVTFSLMSMLAGTFAIIPLIIAIYYAGELVWRDRDRKMHEIIDATALPNWAYMAPKTLAVSVVLVSALFVSGLAAIAIQSIRGYFDYELIKYFTWYILPLGADLILIAVLSVFVQALSPNKYIGWAIMLVYFISTITLNNLGFEHPLYQYGSTGENPVSDLNNDNIERARNWWLRLYWGGFAGVFAVLAHLLWRRGTETSIKPRLRQMPSRLLGTPGAIMLASVAVAAGSGAYIFYNTNILNEYRTTDDAEKQLADYEKKYLKYENVEQPAIRQISLNVDLFPDEKRAEFSGSYELINDTDTPIETLHVRFNDPDIEIVSIAVAAAKLEQDDSAMKYQIYRFDQPMAVGEKRSLSFQTRRHQKGFRASNQDVRLVENGTFLNNGEFSPWIGMDRNGLLSDRQTRRKYDLPPELRPAKLEDESARMRNYVGNTDWVMSDITITTSSGQVPIAPGNRISDEVEGDRRTARFVSKSPILAFFSIQSADYATRQRTADGVEMTVYYYPDHDFNVDTMLDATETSLAYYNKNFGPYQFDHARIIEFPGYAQFAQAFAGTVPFSETIGFIANNKDLNEIDYVTYVTAHEFGHQYWAHQLISANMQGGTLLVETMAQYSALMVMKQVYGEDKIRRFLQYELDRYLSERGGEAVEELPLNRVEGQGYIHYRKGAVVMYLLQDRLGEDRVNIMLAALLDRYKFKGPPYAISTDLVDGFKSLARNDAERQLVSDLLEKITLYDLKASDAGTRKLADGRFETILTIEAAKFYADGLGKETKADLRDEIDIGLFTAKPGKGAFDSKDVLHKRRHKITSGTQKIRIVTKKRPEFAGVDPYNKYIDRNSDDNIIAVE
ncbi:M1 family aminopeptidase [Parasphingorhabdus sp.]|uniref:ABC transporter permease/M1 family aminopeptidase n=1 Tax=Parasphingorhabdus sp. TaxID=2709688 RepID=UPI003C7704F1